MDAVKVGEGSQAMRELTMRMWCRVHAAASCRRDDTGGITDDTAMIGILAGAAVLVGGIIYALVTGAAQRIDIGF